MPIVPDFLNAIAMPAAVERIYEFFGEKCKCYFVVDLKFNMAVGPRLNRAAFILRITKRVNRPRKCISCKHNSGFDRTGKL
jgi:hypothetical protein